MDRDWLFSGDGFSCGVRAAAVLVKGNRILVQREKDGDEYALPGGHIKLGETLEEGLVRETEEEMGVRVKCERLLWSEESFWEWNGKQTHELNFYFLVEPCGELDIPENGEFVSQKDNCNVVLGWMPIEALERLTIYPEFLKAEIETLDGPIRHFVTRA